MQSALLRQCRCYLLIATLLQVFACILSSGIENDKVSGTEWPSNSYPDPQPKPDLYSKPEPVPNSKHRGLFSGFLGSFLGGSSSSFSGGSSPYNSVNKFQTSPSSSSTSSSWVGSLLNKFGIGSSRFGSSYSTPSSSYNAPEASSNYGSQYSSDPSSSNGQTSQTSFQNQAQCGIQAPGFEPEIKDSNARIINGYEAVSHSWPWQVALHIGGSLCGGTIIAPDVIVTAAHCLKNKRTIEVDVFAGAHHAFGKGDSESVRVKGRGMQHPEYNPSTEENDIALMKLQQPLTFNQFIKPICLPPSGQDPPPGAECIISGWGRTKFVMDSNDPSTASTLPSVLQQATVPIVDQNECMSNPKLGPKLREMMMCAGGGSTDACQGDSGGPLVCKAGGKWVLFGVTSWGFACGEPGVPGVYTRTSRYVNWINSMINSGK